MTFEDLKFEKHSGGSGVRAVHDFPNGYRASVVGGPIFFYGDGVNTFELAVMRPGEGVVYDTPITSNVLENLSKAEVTAALVQIEALPKVKK